MQELDALKQKDLSKLNKLVTESVPIQMALDQGLSEIDPAHINNNDIKIMKEIQNVQETIIKEVQTGAFLLKKRIQKLRQTKTSLRGYKQQRVTTPRFLNKTS
ncbi:MAG: hypothetical protein U9P49_08580 [Thermodesulfobacteriota bacterium]|nr:hypothetical protein [Thermodesulfobacteriota bacterium]